MWQVSWMLSLIPDSVVVWITYAILAIGVGLYVASKLVSWIPLMGQYKLPAELVGVILLVVGAYVFGGRNHDVSLRERIKELEAKVAVSEQQSKEANTKLDTAIKEKNKVIKDVQIVIKDRIVKGSVKMDAVCKVDDEAISILNDAAKNVKGKK
jgi:hypothetical protein